MDIQLPGQVKFIIDTLEEAGFEAYAVGGCVRDSIIGKEPQDWDITTIAKPEQVKALFRRTVDTGIAHGTVTVMLEKDGYEVTTYRIDGTYEDARHPKEVTFTPDLLEDLKRRDFTINAMAYHPQRGLVDAFGGMEDMQAGIIRCVGDPAERFAEDALRMLRAVRFAAQLGFTVEQQTRQAIADMAPLLGKVSAERIQVELVKLLVSGNPQEMRTLYETGVSAVILPEWDAMMETQQRNPHHAYTVGEHTLRVLTHTPPERIIRLAALFHDVAKPVCRTVDAKGIHHFYGHPEQGAVLTKKIMRRLKFDNAAIDMTARLVAGHDVNPAPNERSVRRAIRRVGLSCYPAVFDLKYADICGQSDYRRQEKFKALEVYRNLYRNIMERGDCLTLKELAVNGKDLMELGIPAGRQLGTILAQLLELVVEDPKKNTKEYLTGYTLKNLFIR